MTDTSLTITMAYDDATRTLSTSETDPVIGTKGDSNSTQVVVTGTSGLIPATAQTSTYNGVYIVFDVRVMSSHTVDTEKVKLDDDGEGEVPSEVFNSVILDRLPVQLMVRYVDSAGVKRRYFSYNILTFRVARAIYVSDN